MLAPPSRLQARGVQPAMLAPGATVDVRGYPSQADPTELRAEWIRIDGTTYQLR